MRLKELKNEVVIDAIWDGLELTYTIRTQMDDGDGKTIDDLDYLSIPFFPKPCLILIGLITIRKRTVKTKGAPGSEKKTGGRFFFFSQFCWTN